MPIEVEGPDGKVHNFPDNTPHDAINQQMSQMYGGQSGGLSPIQQRAGDATPASGAVTPSMQSVPAYHTDEDRRNMAMGLLFPHMNQIIQNTPGHAQRMEQAKVVGKRMGDLEEKQRAGRQILKTLEGLGTSADKGAAEGNLDSAIGPLESNQTFQSVRNLIPVVGQYYDKAYNLNNLLHHDVHGLTTAFIGASGGSGNMSDARQGAFQETMGAMMKATNKEDFDRIKNRAADIIKQTFGLETGTNVDPMPSSRGSGASAAPVRRQFLNNQTGQLDTFELKDGAWVKAQ